MARENKFWWSILVGFLLFLGLFVTGHYNYLLFHTLTEMFAVVVACSILILAWNSHQYMDNNYLLLLGITAWLP
jgi:undecaprenyl pyrophosphate phosphatase UppP